MGFFSKDCNGCEHPLLSHYATNKVNAWMERAVAVHQDGTVLTGDYNGYGRFEECHRLMLDTPHRVWQRDFDQDGENVIDGATVWHLACWEKAKAPTAFNGESPDSWDQGYFFDPGAHDMHEPYDDPFEETARSKEHNRLGIPTSTEPAVETSAGDEASGDTEDQQDPGDGAERALRLILAQNGGACENSTAGIGACFDLNGRTADAKYGADQACAACIAHYALTGQDIPLGPGRHAQEG